MLYFLGKISDLADGELAGGSEFPCGGGEVSCVLRDRTALTALLKYTANFCGSLSSSVPWS